MRCLSSKATRFHRHLQKCLNKSNANHWSRVDSPESSRPSIISAIRFDLPDGTKLLGSREGASSTLLVPFLPIPRIGPSLLPSEKLTDRRGPCSFPVGVGFSRLTGAFRADTGVGL